MIVNLIGEAYDLHQRLEGRYILGTNQVNDKACWIHQQNSSYAIWYDPKFRAWRIGENLGGTYSRLKTSDDAIGPLEASTWKYCIGSGVWIESTNLVSLSVGKDFQFVCLST